MRKTQTPFISLYERESDPHVAWQKYLNAHLGRHLKLKLGFLLAQACIQIHSLAYDICVLEITRIFSLHNLIRWIRDTWPW